MRKLLRIISIVFISTAILWMGVNSSPNSNQVEAKVFDTLFSFAKDMPGYMLKPGEDAEPRKIKVNGNQTYLTVQNSDDEIAQILDFYEDQYEPLRLDTQLRQKVEKIEGNHADERLVKAYKVLDCMRKKRQFRYQSENYGFWCTFEFRDKALELASDEYLEKFTEATESGKLGEIGTFRVAMVLKPDDHGKARILNFWTDEDFDLNNLSPDASGDMPGEDIENIPRFAGAIRQLSIAQENRETLDRVVVYESEGSVVNHILYYHTKMANEGWQPVTGYEKNVKMQTKGDTMLYKRSGRECTVSISQDTENGKIITTITDRKAISG